MTTVTSATAAASTSTASAAAQTTSTDYEMFLKMMTTQIRNQDPLNPMDSTAYATQLATFSGVEQQVQTNQLLAGLSTQFSVLGMAQLAGWVGQQARADVPVHFDGSAVTISPNPAQGATRAVLVARDEDGTVVAREDIPVSSDPYQWLGADIAGDPLPEGTYTLELESYGGDTLLDTSSVESYATIVEAQAGSNGIRLLLEGGASVDATAVTALRRV